MEQMPLKITPNLLQKNLCRQVPICSLVKVHVLVPKKIPSSHLFSSDDVIDSFCTGKPHFSLPALRF
jgi:hypothetical protein